MFNEMSREFIFMDIEAPTPNGTAPLKCTLVYEHVAVALFVKRKPAMGYNEIVLMGASPVHSFKVNESRTFEVCPTINLEENVTIAFNILSL
jgi:hypothetical protein